MLFTKLTSCLVSLFALTACTVAVVLPSRSELESRVYPRATEPIQSGLVFTIHNVKADTVVDLSAGDNKTITGWSLNGGKNQQWTTIWTGESWNFQSVETGLYLGFTGTAGNGTNLTVASTPTAWDIWHDTVNETNYRIFAPNTTVNWDLWGYGDAISGDPITLWGAWSGIHQTWRFVQGMHSIYLLML
ncbi:putative mannanase [Lentinula detonsa]|uniref:Mannanase n=1 Tax=Lentinula detonsa TaxID=2804962 RepID=A0A9W8TTT8_9AGAR|nr:putative mannanase [Lentinula detonsa]